MGINNDWSSFTLRVNIKTALKNVFPFFDTPEGWEKWFLRKAVFLNPQENHREANESIETHDQYEFYWHGYSDDVCEKGVVMENNGTDEFCISFSKNAPVRFSLSREEGETIVTLKATEIETDDLSKMSHYVQDSRGWTFYLLNLKSVIEHQADLRNKNEELKDLITA